MERPIDEEEFDKLCAEYRSIQLLMEKLNEDLKTCRGRIDGLLGNRESHSTSKFTAQIKRSVAYTWDQEELTKFETTIPEIKTKRLIDKGVYEAMSPEKQSLLTNALMIKKGRVTLNITTAE